MLHCAESDPATIYSEVWTSYEQIGFRANRPAGTVILHYKMISFFFLKGWNDPLKWPGSVSVT